MSDLDATRQSIQPVNRSRLEEGLELVFAKLLSEIAPPFPELMTPAETPESFLPYLAADRGVSEWNSDATEAEKRATVEGAWPTKRLAGTRRALELAVTGLQLVPEVTPWYEQAPRGEPYSFLVRAFSEGPYSSEMDDRLDKRLAAAKSERDTMLVSIGLRATGTHYIGAATFCAEIATVYPLVLEGVEVASAEYLAAGTFSTETTTIYPMEA